MNLASKDLLQLQCLRLLGCFGSAWLSATFFRPLFQLAHFGTGRFPRFIFSAMVSAASHSFLSCGRRGGSGASRSCAVHGFLSRRSIGPFRMSARSSSSVFFSSRRRIFRRSNITWISATVVFRNSRRVKPRSTRHPAQSSNQYSSEPTSGASGSIRPFASAQRERRTSFLLHRTPS